jgi:diketogulonate reductase-like aldo/keto reductase
VYVAKLPVAYRNEDSVGVAIAETEVPRSELYITTKYSGQGTIPDSINASLSKVCNGTALGDPF